MITLPRGSTLLEMNNGELEQGEHNFARAFESHADYAVLLAQMGLCPRQDSALDETYLRPAVSRFLAIYGGMDTEASSEYARGLVPYYDSYAGNCREGKVARNALPDLLSVTLLHQIRTGNFELLSQIKDAHTAIVATPDEPTEKIDHVQIGLPQKIEMKLEEHIDGEVFRLTHIVDDEQSRQNFKKGLRRLVNANLLDYSFAKKKSQEAGCGCLWSFTAWLLSK